MRALSYLRHDRVGFGNATHHAQYWALSPNPSSTSQGCPIHPQQIHTWPISGALPKTFRTLVKNDGHFSVYVGHLWYILQGYLAL